MKRDQSHGRRAVRYPPHSPLRRELTDRVDAYFRREGKRPEAGPRLWIKAAVILAWLALSYALLVFWATTWWQVVPLTASLALATAGVGFNIQHDGGHGAYARRALWNRLSASSLDLVGGSSYVWRFKHTLIHHHYTNIEGVDEDIEVRPFLRLAPGQPRHWFHRFQHLYVWFLYVFLPAKWHFYDDFRDVILGRVGKQRIPRPRGWSLVFLLAAKVVFAGFVVFLPFALHAWYHVLLVYALWSLVLGTVLATTFQLAHCVGEATFTGIPDENEAMERCWAEHQLATTVDFAPRSRVLSWYLGGLNYQVEHHLFPGVSHTHYPALAPIVRRVCRKHGVPHHRHDTVWKALRSHVGLLRDMGRRPAETTH